MINRTNKLFARAISCNLKKAFSLLLAMLLSVSIMAQERTVTGMVTDEEGQPLIGVGVTIPNTAQGTLTAVDGKYSLLVDPSSASLQFSYVGYVTQIIKLDGKTSLDVTLVEDNRLLEEVVVIGYGVMRKSDLTGAVASVKGSDMTKTTPAADISSALQGRLPGVSVVSSSGQPGAEATIRIRGANSLLGDTGPLVVIDGIIGGNLASLNPSDIASVEVLKDASATAIYGSRGANGVLLVTTRTPTIGKVLVSYNGYVNFKTPYSLPSLMSPGDFADLANQYHAAINNNPNYYTPEQVARYKAGEGYDYIDALFKDVAIEHTHEISISGGSKDTRFLFSGSYTDNDGIMAGSNNQRFNYRLKVDTDIKKWLSVGFNFWGDYTKSRISRASERSSPLISALTFPNTTMPTDENGNYNNINAINTPQSNPRLFIDGIDTDGYNYSSQLQGYVNVELLKGLDFRMTQSVRFDNQPDYNTFGENSYEYYFGNSNNARARFDTKNNYEWINTNMISYVKEFNADHRINITGVLEQQYSDNVDSYIDGQDIRSSLVGANNPSLGSTITTDVTRSKASILSYMGRANYVFKNRYMLTASIRRDGSSRLAKENRWESFASAAVAWNIAEESFIKNIDVIDQMKLRYGYGEVGNQSVPNYIAYDRFGSRIDPSGSLALIRNRLRNADLKWERTKQHNLGIDLGFLNNRLTFVADVYNKETSDVLLDVTTGFYTGYTSKQGNVGTIQNKGIEVTIGTVPVITKDFSWSSELNLGHNRGIIKSLNDGTTFSSFPGIESNLYFRNFVGKKLGTFYGYVSDGVWTTAEVAALPADMPNKPLAGSYRYKDLNNDGVIRPEDDRTIIGNGQPSFQWGWNNTFTYKSFDASLFVIGVHGFDIYNFTKEARYNDTASGGIVVLAPSPGWADRWQEGVNENTDLAGFVSRRNVLPSVSKWIEKGDFVKVKSITVGYTIPKSMTSKLDISHLRVYLSLQNPFMITSYSGIDPEVTLKNPLKSGIDYGYYPNGRNYLLGLNLTF